MWTYNRMGKNYLYLATFMHILFEKKIKILFNFLQVPYEMPHYSQLSLTIYPGAHTHFPVMLSQSAPFWQGQVSWQPSP